MVKRYIVIVAALVLTVSAYAETKPCEQLKSEIAKKLDANSVKLYSLEIVAKDTQTQGKVVGSCEAGTKKIVYNKGEARPQNPPKQSSKQ